MINDIYYAFSKNKYQPLKTKQLFYIYFILGNLKAISLPQNFYCIFIHSFDEILGYKRISLLGFSIQVLSGTGEGCLRWHVRWSYAESGRDWDNYEYTHRSHILITIQNSTDK